MAETKVLLSCKVLQVKDREFNISHAQNLLAMEKKMGVNNWELTDKKFMLKDGIIQLANTRADKRATIQGAADKGAEA